VTRLTLRLFGPPLIELDGQTVQLGRHKAVALLAFLALTRQPRARAAAAHALPPQPHAGEPEQAIEIHALATRHPFAAGSPWFEDVFGHQITAAWRRGGSTGAGRRAGSGGDHEGAPGRVWGGGRLGVSEDRQLSPGTGAVPDSKYGVPHVVLAPPQAPATGGSECESVLTLAVATRICKSASCLCTRSTARSALLFSVPRKAKERALRARCDINALRQRQIDAAFPSCTVSIFSGVFF